MRESFSSASASATLVDELIEEVIKNNRVVLVHLTKQLEADDADIRMRGGRTTHLEVVPPLTRIHGDNNLSLGAVWQNRTGLLWLSAQGQQLLIVPVSILHSIGPLVQEVHILWVAPERGLGNCDGTAELLVAVVAVAGALLRVGGDAVPDNLMGYATVNNEAGRDSPMLQHTFVAALDNAGDELMSGTIANLTLGLIASPASALNLAEQFLGRRAILDVGLHQNNLNSHYSSPPESVSNCPA